MFTYTFEIAIGDLATHETIEIFKGAVQAESASSAQKAAWPAVIARCTEYRAQGHRVGVGDFYARMKEGTGHGIDYYHGSPVWYEGNKATFICLIEDSHLAEIIHNDSRIRVDRDLLTPRVRRLSVGSEFFSK